MSPPWLMSRRMKRKRRVAFGVFCCSGLEWSWRLCHLSMVGLTISSSPTCCPSWCAVWHRFGKKVGRPEAFMDTSTCFADSWGFCVALESSVLSAPNVQGFSGPVAHSCPDTEVSGSLCKACRWGGGIYTHRLVHTQSLYWLIFLLLWQNNWHSILRKEGFILATIWGRFLPSSGVMMKFSFLFLLHSVQVSSP